jgi:hypothetical protein
MLTDISSPVVTNKIAWYLEAGLELTQPPPTNQPGGWAAYAQVFRDLRSVCGFPNAADGKSVPLNYRDVAGVIFQDLDAGIYDPEQGLPIRLPQGYTPDEMSLDLELNWRIPDLSTGKCTLPDILVALEWVRTEWPLMLRHKKGNFVAIDCRKLTRQQWEEDTSLSLFRGMAALRLPCPLWFVQSAGQQIETWPLVGERPIFTEHVQGQFPWMWDIFYNRSEMQTRYEQTSGLELSKQLRDVCASGGL